MDWYVNSLVNVILLNNKIFIETGKKNGYLTVGQDLLPANFETENQGAYRSHGKSDTKAVCGFCKDYFVQGVQGFKINNAQEYIIYG